MKFRVAIQQPSLPTYRRPFFELLSRHIDLTLLYGFDGVPSDTPMSVSSLYYPLKRLSICGKIELKWHSAQIKAITRKFDVAILSWDIQYITLWIALLKKLIYGRQVILWGHGYSKNDNVLRRALRNFPIKFADAVILYDYHTANRLKESPSSRKKIFVAPNSIDQTMIDAAITKITKDVSILQGFTHKHELSNTFNLIYIGRIYPANRFEILIEAVAECLKSLPSLKLIVIGKLNSYTDELKTLANKLGIGNCITWVGELYDEEQIAPWMLSSHVFCYPANIGLSIMHAFGYGLPVITDDNYSSHNPEIWAFSNGVNGLSYRREDVNDFCYQIIRLFNDPELRLSLSENAKRTVVETFTIEKMADGFFEAINYVQNR